MVVRCEQVWQEISNYLENDLDPSWRAALDGHFQACPKCASVLAGTRNVVGLYGDERLFELPLGFGGRLQKCLAQEMPGKRGSVYGWVVAFAALGLIAGSLALARVKTPVQSELRSPHAKPGKNIPARLMVLVAGNSRIFHIAGCDVLRTKTGKIRSLTAEEAEHEGFVPCVRCLGKYVAATAVEFFRKHFPSEAAV